MLTEEMSQRRDFYTDHPEAGPSASSLNACEERGEAEPPATSTPLHEDHISLCLQHCPRLPRPGQPLTQLDTDDGQVSHTHFSFSEMLIIQNTLDLIKLGHYILIFFRMCIRSITQWAKYLIISLFGPTYMYFV